MLNKELLLLSILLVSCLSILFILLVYLMIRKMIVNQKNKAVRNYTEKYNSIIFKILSDREEIGTITPISLLKVKAFEKVLSKYAKILEGKEEKQHLSKIAEVYLSNYYHHRIKSIRWSIRMNTLHQIEDLYMTSFLNEVQQILRRKRVSHEELIQSLKILALFDCSKIFSLLTKTFLHLSEYEYRNILIRTKTKLFDQFVLHFHQSNPSLQMAVLEVISIKKERIYLTFLEKIFSIYKGEVRLRALKAIANIGYVKEIAPYLKLLYSTKWEERMMSAKLIGTIREEKGVSRLIELLQDPSWWVRSQAAQAISNFSNGEQLLREVLQTSEDPFARDMAWEWLNKGG